MNVIYKVVTEASWTQHTCPDETEEQYHERLALCCLEMIFEQRQVLCAVIGRVKQINQRYGSWAAIAAADAVLHAFCLVGG